MTLDIAKKVEDKKPEQVANFISWQEIVTISCDAILVALVTHPKYYSFESKEIEGGSWWIL